jgi:membrane fusion protein, multidrug efflux system
MKLRIALLLLAFAPVVHADELSGIVYPIKQVSVASPVLQEVVESVLVEEGDTVKEGQVLVQLRAEKESLQVEQYKKLVEQREFTAKGAEALSKEKMMSKEAVLEKQTELELAKIQLRQAEVAFKEKTVRSPIKGIVVKKYKEAGESVDRVEKLVDVVNIDQVYVQYYLEPKLLTAIKVDQVIPVHFPVIAGGKFEGKVSFVDPRIDERAVTFRVKVLINNPGHVIKAGMRGHADFDHLIQQSAKR